MSNLKLSKTGIFLLLFLVALVIYSGSINGEFLFDDKILITQNIYVKDLKYVPVLFTTDEYLPAVIHAEKTYNYYRPLQTLSFALNYRIWGLQPFGYHLTNILFHSIVAFLVFCLLARLFSDPPLALLSALLFCVHPLHTESVSSISGGAELLVSLFTLMTLLFYIKYLSSRRGSAFIIAIFSFMLALISKEAGFLVLVPFVVLFAGIRAKIPRDSAFFHFFIFFGIIVIYAILRLNILAPLKMLPYGSSSFLLDVINFSRALIAYTKLLVLPRHLHILRTIPLISSFRLSCLVLPVCIAALGIAVFILSVKKKNFVLFFGMSWFVLSLLHLLKSMHKFGSSIAMEEHWAYFASIGFFVILAYVILRLKKFKVLAAVSAIIIYAALAFINSLHWRDQLDFYRYNLKFVRADTSLIPRFNYAVALGEKGLYKEALSETENIVKSDPENLSVYILRGDIYKKTGEFDQAENAYRQALQLDRFCWQANLRLKDLARKTGRPYEEKSEPWLSAQEAKIISRFMNGEFYDAIIAADRALESVPTPMLYTLKGIIFAKTGHYRAAINAYNDALKLDPRNKTAMHNLSVLYYNINQLDKAEELRKRIERIE
jgi:protein O-mannosyl-transferase